MSFGTILIEKKDKLATELNAALCQLDEDNEVRVVVIKGAGKVFSTGIDVSEFYGKTPLECHRWLTLMDQMYFTIASMEKPVITMVHGYAVASGAGLVAAAGRFILF